MRLTFHGHGKGVMMIICGLGGEEDDLGVGGGVGDCGWEIKPLE